ncbi:MAG: YdcF family protein [Mycobacteriales bacterium]
MRAARVTVGGVLLRVAAAAVLAAVLIVAATAVRVWQVARSDDRPHSDAIVVLGAAQYNGTPSEIYQYRLRHARALYRAGVAAHIVTLGGNRPGDKYTEGGAGASYLEQHGVPSSALTAVGAGNDTLGSIRAAAKVFKENGWTSAVLVTDPWHELRSAKMAEDSGIRAATSPVQDGPVVRSRTTEIHYLGRETAAYLYYRVFHKSSDSSENAV